MVSTVSATAPDGFALEQNHPNPTRGLTEIPFGIAEDAHVRLEVYDLRGRQVASVVDAAMPAGSYKVTWDGRDSLGAALASGVYFYRLRAGDTVLSRRLTLTR